MKKLQILFFAFFISTLPLLAQWQNDPSGPLAICAEAGDQKAPYFIGDGTDGYYIFWIDWRDGHGAVYGQHLDKDGNALWDVSGKTIIDYSDHDASMVKAILNNEGNIILSWQHYLSGSYPDTLYAQKLNSDGESLWAKPVAVAGNDISTGGAYWGPIEFTILENGGGCYFAVQLLGVWNYLVRNKIEADGTLTWGYNGKVFDGILPAGNLKLLSDGAGGAFISWDYFHSYVQRFNADGDLLWGTPTEMTTCTGGYGGTYAGFPYFLLSPDGSGGLTAAWSSLGRDIYATRINNDGNFEWVEPCSEIYGDGYTQEEIAFSKSGDSYYVSWVDSRPDSVGIYMQKFNNAGEVQWPEELYIEDTSIYVPVIKSVTTSEGDVAIFYQAAGQFYAQKVHPDGSTEWTQPIEILSYDYEPFYQNYQLLPAEDGNVIGVAETISGVGEVNIYAFNLNFISGDTITEDTTVVALEDISSFKEQYILSPNPASEFIQIQMLNENSVDQILIMNETGVIIKTLAFTENVDVSDLAAGLYFMQINETVQKFLKL